MHINSVSLSLRKVENIPSNSQTKSAGDSSNIDSRESISAKHSLDDTQKNTPNFKISHTLSTGREPTREERLASSLRSLVIFVRELPKETKALDQKVNTLESILAEKVPNSIDKDWDFSINEDGTAAVIGNELSESERDEIASIIDSSGIGKNLSTVRDLMVEALEEDRGVSLYSSNIGKYDLTDKNFSEIVYFREYLSESKPGGEGESLAKQLNARANEVYNKKETVDVYV